MTFLVDKNCYNSVLNTIVIKTSYTIRGLKINKNCIKQGTFSFNKQTIQKFRWFSLYNANIYYVKQKIKFT